MSKKKHGFILKMFPGNKKQKERSAIILTILIFIISFAIFFDTYSKLDNNKKAEAFAERVSNTKSK